MFYLLSKSITTVPYALTKLSMKQCNDCARKRSKNPYLRKKKPFSGQLNMMQDYYKIDTFCTMTNGDDVTEMVHNYEEFVQKRSVEDPLFSFWSKYIEMVQLLLRFIRATRTTDWQLYLSILKSMIPWFFVTDRINYSRYASSYWLEMKCLDETNPCKLEKAKLIVTS